MQSPLPCSLIVASASSMRKRWLRSVLGPVRSLSPTLTGGEHSSCPHPPRYSQGGVASLSTHHFATYLQSARLSMLTSQTQHARSAMDVKIPALMVSSQDGFLLRDATHEFPDNVTVSLYGTKPTPQDAPNSSTTHLTVPGGA